MLQLLGPRALRPSARILSYINLLEAAWQVLPLDSETGPAKFWLQRLPVNESPQDRCACEFGNALSPLCATTVCDPTMALLLQVLD